MASAIRFRCRWLLQWLRLAFLTSMMVALSALAACLVLPAIIRLLRPRFLTDVAPLAAGIVAADAVGASSP